ncbi:MAG: chlorite dismutase family protein [Anaerolineae bacterium]
MPEQTPKTLNHFSFYSFSDPYWTLPAEDKAAFHQAWLGGLRQAADAVEIYQVFPASTEADILVWSAMPAEDTCRASQFFTAFAGATNPHRRLIRPVHALWGFTKPSVYTKTRSTQEIDPFASSRRPYLILYPFVKTLDWYLMSREARQGMMNEHIKLGKEYPQITQLLLYSFGLQNQEFVVVYETDDLTLFSDLVNRLRSTEARRYTGRDTPLYTAIHHPAHETLALWK